MYGLYGQTPRTAEVALPKICGGYSGKAAQKRNCGSIFVKGRWLKKEKRPGKRVQKGRGAACMERRKNPLKPRRSAEGSGGKSKEAQENTYKGLNLGKMLIKILQNFSKRR